MNEIHTIMQMLTQAGIEADEIFAGDYENCPVCRCAQQLAA